MIECSSENIWYKKRRGKKLKRFSTFFLILLIFTAMFLYYKCVISEKIEQTCSNYAYAFSTEAVNTAVLNSLNATASYSELIYIEKNASGDIVLMSTDSHKVNLINKEIATKTEKLLKEKLIKGVPIPLLAFSGISIISGYGPSVNYKVLSVSSVLCDFISTFKSVGINQTLHSIYVEVISEVKINFFLKNTIEKCKTKVLICEAVLVGKVPDVYLNGQLFN